MLKGEKFKYDIDLIPYLWETFRTVIKGDELRKATHPTQI